MSSACFAAETTVLTDAFDFQERVDVVSDLFEVEKLLSLCRRRSQRVIDVPSVRKPRPSFEVLLESKPCSGCASWG